jgi:hypothetical protein
MVAGNFLSTRGADEPSAITRITSHGVKTLKLGENVVRIKTRPDYVARRYGLDLDGRGRRPEERPLGCLHQDRRRSLPCRRRQLFRQRGLRRVAATFRFPPGLSESRCYRSSR